MSRREFTKPIKRQALDRAVGKCEGCRWPLIGKVVHFDHIIADGLGGEPTLENCRVLCKQCHQEKTSKHDVPMIAKAKRVSDKHLGITKTKRPIGSRGFDKSEPQHTATRPIERRS